MISFTDSSLMAELNEAAYTESSVQGSSSISTGNSTKKSKLTNYSEFYERCQDKKTIINSKLEKLNAYFKNKYPDFYGISLCDSNEDYN